MAAQISQRTDRISSPENVSTVAIDLSRANAILAELCASYPFMIEPQLNRLNSAWADIMQRPTVTEATVPDQATPIEEAMNQIYRFVHDFEGHGGSFGYPVVSAIAQSLCELLKQRPAFDAATYDVIDRHIAAINSVISWRLAGDGGLLGQVLLGQLNVRLADTLS